MTAATPTVGVIGASGAIGSAVSRELARRPRTRLVLGARHPERIAGLGLDPSAEAVSAHVDLFDPASLADFVSACDLVVNCAGPSHFIEDRIARAAVGQGKSLVDVGGAESVFPELVSSWTEPAERGLCVLIDAGWIPGVSGVFARQSTQRASAAFESIERVDLYYGDWTSWSQTSTLDLVELFRMRRGAGWMEAGDWQEAPPLGRPRRVRAVEPFGRKWATPSFLTELRCLAEQHPDAVIASHAMSTLGLRSGLAVAVSLAVLGKAPALSARLVRQAMKGDARSSEGGLLAVRVRGKVDGESAEHSATLRATDTYGLTARSCAATVGLLLEDAIWGPGCHYMSEVVDPDQFMARVLTESEQVSSWGAGAS